MAVKTRKELDAMTNDQLVAYLNGLSKANFNGYVDADTKVRYFIYLYGEGIAKAIKGTKLFFSGIVAMKITESGYGRNIPTGSFNFGGVKYNPNIHQDFVLADTSEIVNGKRVFIKAKFAKFKDAEDGIKRNIAVLLGERYKNARINARSPEEQIRMIAQAGYTTTPANSYLKLMQGNIERVRKKTGFGRIE
jgi:flagellum-specific peptidoglycan hydrolase FlgJ